MRKFTIIVFLIVFMLVGCGAQVKVTPEAFKSIKEGITYEEMVEKIGGKPKSENKIGEDIIEYKYDGENGVEDDPTVYFLFSDGKLDTKIELGLITKSESSEEEEDEEPAMEVDTFESDVEEAVHTAVGEETNMGKDRIIEVNANKGAGTVVLKLAGNENLTSGLTKGGLLKDSGKVLKALFELEDVERVNLQWMLPAEDGTDLQAMKILLYRESAKKVNWKDDLIYNEIPRFAESYFVHPSL